MNRVETPKSTEDTPSAAEGGGATDTEAGSFWNNQQDVTAAYEAHGCDSDGGGASTTRGWRKIWADNCERSREGRSSETQALMD